jgi:hypothetical protein
MADYGRLPGAVHQPWEWQERAACRGLQLKIFFHSHHERDPTRLRREAEAKAVCHRCPVISAASTHSACRSPTASGVVCPSRNASPCCGPDGPPCRPTQPKRRPSPPTWHLNEASTVLISARVVSCPDLDLSAGP